MLRSLALVAIFSAAACQSADAPDRSTSSPSRSGQYILETQCAACHATGRTDRSNHRDAPAFRTLGRRYPIVSLEGPLAEGIIVGHPDMPEFQFEPQEVSAVISYLESIQED